MKTRGFVYTLIRIMDLYSGQTHYKTLIKKPDINDTKSLIEYKQIQKKYIFAEHEY